MCGVFCLHVYMRTRCPQRSVEGVRPLGLELRVIVVLSLQEQQVLLSPDHLSKNRNPAQVYIYLPVLFPVPGSVASCLEHKEHRVYRF